MAGHPSLVSEEADRSLGQLVGVFRAEERRLAQARCACLFKVKIPTNTLSALARMQEKADLDKQAEGLARQAAALEQERQQMAAIGVADNDVLELNVGGRQIAAKRATLTQVSPSWGLPAYACLPPCCLTGADLSELRTTTCVHLNRLPLQIRLK